MPFFNNLPIMPKESKAPISTHSSTIAPYPTPTSAGPRTAAIWSASDDDILLQARASGLNWQPIASRYFPNKSANACRKRHERLIERRQASDWDAEKLERLAQEYVAVRKEMWEILASRLGQRWAVVEAKCMEKGLKTLQATARTAERRNTGSSRNSFDEEQGIKDHARSDSGILMGSDAEMEIDEPAPLPKLNSSWHAHTGTQHNHQEHVRSRSLPQPIPQLPLYQPPPPIITHVQAFDNPITTSPATMSYVRSTSSQRCSPDSQNGRGGISIQSVLSPPEQCV